MAPRSPTHAFDPTPALEHNKDNFSPFNEPSPDTSMARNGFDVLKEVRFSDTIGASVHGRHSIATSNVPLLPAIHSASQIPKQSFRITNTTSSIDITAYFEQCRNVNDQLRQAHEQERKAWDIERAAMRTRIADLEFRLNRARDPRRRLSNDSSTASASSFRPDFRLGANLFKSNGVVPKSAPAVPTVHATPPVWQTDSPKPATRVFSHDDDVQHLPSISEDEGQQKRSSDVSPHGTGPPVESTPIPGAAIDINFDGIMLRSEGVKSSFSKIISPQFGSPALSPSQKSPKIMVDTQIIPSLQIDSATLLSPLDEKLKRFAGHTPLAFDGPLSDSQSTVGPPTPSAEKPLAPAPTKRPPLRPSENSDSYFSYDDMGKVRESVQEANEEEEKHAEEVAEANAEILKSDPEAQFEPEEDPPLKGPLMLGSNSKSQMADAFLEKVDAKLREAASKESSPTRTRQDSVLSDNNAPPPKTNDEPDHEMPSLRMKKSTNFGSAYGMTMPGRAF